MKRRQPHTLQQSIQAALFGLLILGVVATSPTIRGNKWLWLPMGGAGIYLIVGAAAIERNRN
jgi:hypothetical protein